MVMLLYIVCLLHKSAKSQHSVSVIIGVIYIYLLFIILQLLTVYSDFWQSFVYLLLQTELVVRIFRLHRMHKMHSILSDVLGICLSVSLAIALLYTA